MAEKILFNASDIDRALGELAARIGAQPDALALIGIHTNGVPLASRLAQRIAGGGKAPEIGALDITLYRDDLAGRALPLVRGSEIPFDITDRRIVLVDDVLFTGRTIRAALDVLADYGRPRCVQLCVLVDRGHRELPIAADFCGLRAETQNSDRIRVRLTESGAAYDEIVLIS